MKQENIPGLFFCCVLFGGMESNNIIEPSDNLITYFPGECKEYMKRYMNCLKENNNDNSKCRTESKDYLQCRMDRYNLKFPFYSFYQYLKSYLRRHSVTFPYFFSPSH